MAQPPRSLARGRERRVRNGLQGERHAASVDLRAGPVAKGRFRAVRSARDVSKKLLQRRLMGFPLDLALRYMGSRKRAFISVGTMFATLGVALGVGALATVMSVTGGFRAQFREKVLGVNAHVLVLKYATDFREYRQVMEKMKAVPGVTGVAPFVINPMMITHGDRTATGVLLKGVDPSKVKAVLDPAASHRRRLAGRLAAHGREATGPSP